MSECDQPPRPV